MKYSRYGDSMEPLRGAAASAVHVPHVTEREKEGIDVAKWSELARRLSSLFESLKDEESGESREVSSSKSTIHVQQWDEVSRIMSGLFARLKDEESEEESTQKGPASFGGA